MDSYALYINLAGLAVIAVGCLGLIVRAFRHWRKGLAPLMLIGIGLVVTGFPQHTDCWCRSILGLERGLLMASGTSP